MKTSKWSKMVMMILMAVSVFLGGCGDDKKAWQDAMGALADASRDLKTTYNKVDKEVINEFDIDKARRIQQKYYYQLRKKAVIAEEKLAALKKLTKKKEDRVKCVAELEMDLKDIKERILYLGDVCRKVPQADLNFDIKANDTQSLQEKEAIGEEEHRQKEQRKMDEFRKSFFGRGGSEIPVPKDENAPWKK